MGEDEITHATVGLVLNSLDDIHCLTEARHKDTDFLDNILDDDQLHALLNLYDQISTNSYRPFRWVNKIYITSRHQDVSWILVKMDKMNKPEGRGSGSRLASPQPFVICLVFPFSALQTNITLHITHYRHPPSDACDRLKDGLTALTYVEVTDREEATDMEEVNNIMWGEWNPIQSWR